MKNKQKKHTTKDWDSIDRKLARKRKYASNGRSHLIAQNQEWNKENQANNHYF